MHLRLIATARWFLTVSLLLCAPSAIAETHRAILFRVNADYPEIARRMHVDGVVEVRLTIRPDGTVSETHVQSGHALLVPAAQKALAQWRFAPAALTTDVVIQVVFKYEER